MAASLPVCRTSWEPFSSPAAKRHSVTANSPPLFPSLPKTVWAQPELPGWSRYCPQPMAKRCLGRHLSAPASTAEAEPSVARLVPTSCCGSRCRRSREVLTCDTSLGSEAAGGLPGSRSPPLSWEDGLTLSGSARVATMGHLLGRAGF